jgi:aminoglycoside phosphotransferase (APT) family kinase protein
MKFLEWAHTCDDLKGFPLQEVIALQQEFHRSRKTNLVVVHGDPWQGNILTRRTGVLALLDWDEVHIGEPGEMYGRHWILMCSEPRWQEEVVTALDRRNDQFWRAFHAYAWARGIDQLHYEYTMFQGRAVSGYQELRQISPRRAGFADQMLKALRVLGRRVGGPPPARGHGKRRHR